MSNRPSVVGASVDGVRSGAQDREARYRACSLWLDGLEERLEPRPALPGDLTCDVAIVGAGFTGLWTAYYLKSLAPDVSVCVIEQEIAGFGASGRNGGWVSAGIAGRPAVYARRDGVDAVLRAERETHATVDEIGRVIREERIDCGYLKSGALRVAATPPQRERLEAHVHRLRRLGLTEDDVRLLSPAEARELVRGTPILAASFTPHCARSDPARLVRGLAMACERLGVTIYERTTAREVGPGCVRCDTGTVKADAVLRATESYTIRAAGQRSRLLPLYSLMIATERLPPGMWEELGWRDGLVIADQRHLHFYAQRTADGRIAIGGRGAPYRLRRPIHESNERDDAVRERLIRTLHQAFPAAAAARITHHWGGSIGVPRDWSMSVSFDRAHGFGWGGGYSGHGVVASNIVGRTLADLVLDRRTDLTSLPWVEHRSPRWEPEPLRFLASWLIVKSLGSADRYEQSTGRAARRARIVARFLPSA